MDRMMEKSKRISVGVMLGLLLSGCSLTPDFLKPDMRIPESWREAPDNAASHKIPSAWWKGYGSAELDRLAQQALLQNTDLRAGLARIEQARAGVRGAGASLLPGVDASGGAARSDGNDRSAENSYRGQVGVSYEVDLWGRNRAGVSAAEARAEATRFDYDTLSIVTAADTAQSYFDLLSLRARLRIAQGNLESLREVARIVEARFREGRVSQLEASQQRTELAGAEAQQAALMRDVKAALNRLAVLTGEPPQTFLASGDTLAGLTVPQLAPGLPSELLAQRPDIAAAEANLRAANADIGAARAAFFPRLTLGADLTGLASPAGWASTLAASLLGPIFSGGALEAELDRTQARRMELVENYRRAVLVAFQETEDALASTQSAALREVQFTIAAKEAATAYGISRQRFDAGAIDFQTLLDTQRSKLQADDQLVRARLESLSASVMLHKALGGGWENGAPAR